MTSVTNLRLSVAGLAYGMTVAGRPTQPTAYGPAVVTWGADTGLDQPGPSTLSVTVSVPHGHAWPARGDVVELLGDVGTYPDLRLFDGVVDTMRRRQRTLHQPDGTEFDAQVVELGCVDWRGVVARRRIGDQPWPLESARDRVARIMALIPDVPYDADSVFALGWGGGAAPRDVDNQAALDLLVETVSGRDWTVNSGPAGLVFERRRSYSAGPYMLTVRPSGVSSIDPNTRGLPASVVVDADRVLDLDGQINHARLEHPTDPGDPSQNTWPDTSETWQDTASITAYGVSGYSTRTDAVDPVERRRAVQWAVTAGQPRWRLDGSVQLRATSDEWEPSNWASIGVFSSAFREGGYALLIEDAPEDDLTVHRVIGGQFAVGAPGQESVQVNVEPYVIASSGGVPFTEFPPNALCSHMGTITADQLSLVARVTMED